MIHLDTSALVAATNPRGEALSRLESLIDAGEHIHLSAVVLYEWLRGPRTAPELAMQARIFPDAGAISFGPLEAATAAKIYRGLRRPRSREIDIAIAACAIVHDAALWTLNPPDFKDIPGLRLL